MTRGASQQNQPPARTTTMSTRRRIKFVLYEVARVPITALLQLIGGFKVRGARNMPREGPVVVVANHLHNFDPIVLSAALPRPLFYMTKSELFATRASSWLFRTIGGFPVNRGTVDRAALRQALTLLDEGYAVGLFPEGTRSVTATLGKVQPGVALVALQSGAPILPVGITGTENLPFDAKAAGRTRGGRDRARIRVNVGEPFFLPPRRPGAKSDLVAASEQIRQRIAALLPPEYRPQQVESS